MKLVIIFSQKDAYAYQQAYQVITNTRIYTGSFSNFIGICRVVTQNTCKFKFSRYKKSLFFFHTHKLFFVALTMSFQLQVGHYLYIKSCGVLGSAIRLIYQNFIFDIDTPHSSPPSPLKGIILNNYLTPPGDRLLRIITELSRCTTNFFTIQNFVV